MSSEIEKVAIEIEILKDKEAEARVQALASKIKMYAREMNTSFKVVGEGLKDSMAGTSAPIDQAVKSLEEVEPAAKKAGGGLLSLKNIARTALGTLEAMAIFLISKFVGDALAKTIDSVKQLELSFYKLGIAEKALSNAGIDITPEDLQSIADSVVDTFKTVSQIDAQKMVANLAVLTKDLNLTKEQYKQLATIIPLVARQADVSIESATEQIVNGLTKSGKGWADLGITVDANIIKQKAIALGLVATAEAFDKLTAEQQQQIETQALIAIAYEKNIDALKDQDNYLKTLPGVTDSVKSSWENLLTTLGTTFSPQITAGLSTIAGWLIFIDDTLKKNQETIKQLLPYFAALETFMLTKNTSAAFSAFNSTKEAQKNFGDNQNLPEDTPTAPIDPNAIKDNGEEAKKAVEDAHKKVLDAQLKMNQDIENAAKDLARKLDDISSEYQFKRLDEEQKYSQNIQDINRDADHKLQDIKIKQSQSEAKARQDALNKEREYQNKLKEMRENFLMDLDDALHARDARQILKLINQYNLEKTQADRRHQLDKQEQAAEAKLRQQAYEAERKDAEEERKRKLEDAAIAHQRRLEQLAEEESRERLQAQLAYQRKMEDLRQEFANRISMIGAGLVAEYNLTAAMLENIVALYQSIYGAGGAIDQIYAGAKSRMAAQSNISGGTGSAPIGSEDKAPTRTNTSLYHFAEGGRLLASTPTTVTFGEGGPEEAIFRPIDREGRDINKTFGSLGGDSSGSGTLTLEVLASPDLETRIVRNTLGQTAKVVQRVIRSKG